ncbi:PhnD/SsuA/transferrin family substrate-binding protein [Halalkalicoccus tibetensis]|uniref:PhnD/SsuA/transferrin family substrate-binding protein n=1 Tax=Halalkalicoccus tibetensis TaxID=175632 RepID=A0ABD5V452_9EURY
MRQISGDGRGRRAFLKTAGAVGIAGLAGCSGEDGGNGGDDGVDEDADPEEDNVIRFILNPAESDVDMEQQYAPLFDYLEEETGAEVDSTLTSSYSATLSAIRDGHGEIADASPSVAIAGSDIVDVIGIRVAYGADRYFSLIGTTPDSGIEELSDLEGENVGFADNLSVSGSLFPLSMLQEGGLDVGNAPDGDPVDFTAEYSDHDQARETLINRDEVAAAGVGAFSLTPHIPEEQFPDEFMEISAEADNAGTAVDEAELRLLDVSDPIPRAPLLSRSDWEGDLRDDVEEALLSATEEDLIDEDAEEDEQLWFTGVEEGSIDDYEPIQDVMDALDLEFGDIE